MIKRFSLLAFALLMHFVSASQTLITEIQTETRDIDIEGAGIAGGSLPILEKQRH